MSDDTTNANAIITNLDTINKWITKIQEMAQRTSSVQQAVMSTAPANCRTHFTTINNKISELIENIKNGPDIDINGKSSKSGLTLAPIRGGYYYPTSSTRRNKKSYRNRRKRRNKSRR
jgi:hypothetical protein